MGRSRGGGARAGAARQAAITRMHQAAEHLRAGRSIGDQPGARASAAKLLEQLADRDEHDGLDIHLHDRAADLADRILARDPHRAMDNTKPVAHGYGDNGQRRRGDAGITR